MYKNYLILFHILNDCYWKGCDDFDLPPLLGSMNPYLWDSHMPIDRAIYNDWHETSKDFKNCDDLKKAIVALLTSYEKQFHFELSSTIKMVQKMSEKEIDDIKKQIED